MFPKHFGYGILQMDSAIQGSNLGTAKFVKRSLCYWRCSTSDAAQPRPVIGKAEGCKIAPKDS